MPVAYTNSLTVSGASYPLVSRTIIASTTIPAAIFNACANPVVAATISYSIHGTPTGAIAACNVFLRFPSGSNAEFSMAGSGNTNVPALAGVGTGGTFIVHGFESTFPGTPFSSDPVLTIQADPSIDSLTVDALAVFVVYDAVTLKQFDAPVPFLGNGTIDHVQFAGLQSSPWAITGIHSPGNTVPSLTAVYFIWTIAGVAGGSPSTPTLDANWTPLISVASGARWGAIGEYIGSLTDLTPINIQASFGSSSYASGNEWLWANPATSRRRNHAYVIG